MIGRVLRVWVAVGCVAWIVDVHAESTGASPVSANVTVISSGRLSFDYAKRYAVFDDVVHVADGDLTIDSDSMFVAFNEDNTAKRISAAGSVRVIQSDKIATCSTAVCDMAAGTVVLTGEPELRRGKELLKGGKITILRNQDRIICEDNVTLRFPQGTGKRDLKLFK